MAMAGVLWANPKHEMGSNSPANGGTNSVYPPGQNAVPRRKNQCTEKKTALYEGYTDTA